MAVCDICFRHCRLDEGAIGFCRARHCSGGVVEPVAYGALTSLALDPIEKKPLHHFHPGSRIVSVGGFGCNLACPFCQNVEISLADGRPDIPPVRVLTPGELVQLCLDYRDEGNIGLAFTYNEPLIHFEYIRDTAKLLHEQELACVLVTNGSATTETLEQVLPWIDAMNIDLKSFDENYYKKTLNGDLDTTRKFIETAAAACHVEVTTLIIPGENDSDEEMDAIASYLAGVGKKNNRDIPLHISRFFPRSQYADRSPTPVKTVYHLADRARKHLRFVHEGNC